MKLVNIADMDTAQALPSHTAVLRMWDWRKENSTLYSSNIYVNDGQGGWEHDGRHEIERLATRRWQLTHFNQAGEALEDLGTFRTLTAAKAEAYAHLVEKIGKTA